MCHVLLSSTSAKSEHSAQERGNIKPVTRGPWQPQKVRTTPALSSFRHSVLLTSHLGRSLRIDCGHHATRELGPRQLDGFFRFHSTDGDQNETCDLDHVLPLHRLEFGKPYNLFLASHRFKRKSRLGSNGHEPSDELKRIHVLEGLRGLGWVHEDRLTKNVAHSERTFGLLAGQGTVELQREGCGQRVGDDLRLTVVTDENRRAALLVAWCVVQRCRHHPSMHLIHDQLHNSEPARTKKTQHKEAEATCVKLVDSTVLSKCSHGHRRMCVLRADGFPLPSRECRVAKKAIKEKQQQTPCAKI